MFITNPTEPNTNGRNVHGADRNMNPLGGNRRTTDNAHAGNGFAIGGSDNNPTVGLLMGTKQHTQPKEGSHGCGH